MKVASMIDENLEKPHGNRTGLSYGELAVLLLTYIISEGDHRMCCLETYVNEHKRSLEGITGWEIREKEATDDRCGDLLRTLGSSSSLSQIEKSLCQYLVKVYELPTEKARSDTTSFSVHHQIIEGQKESSLLKFGYSKDKRPDLRQYRHMLATLDPVGMPLLGMTLAGNGTDEQDYVPTWRKMTEILEKKDFLYLADSKASSYENRAKIQAEGENYCFPLAMSQPRPKLLADWVNNPPSKVVKILEKEEGLEEKEIGSGFEVPLGSIWIDPENKKRYQWNERWLVVKSNALASRQIKGLERLSLTEAVSDYKEQWQSERGFHRFKKGRLSALPIYFRDEDKIKGLMFLLTIALRVFTLMEFVVRRQLRQSQSRLSGLYHGNPKRSTDRPTPEQILKVFRNLTLYIEGDGETEISCLNEVQQQILRLMNIPESIYTTDFLASG